MILDILSWTTIYSRTITGVLIDPIVFHIRTLYCLILLIVQDLDSLLFCCHDPSHGGFYMAEGAFYIRIGLPPCIVSGDRLVLSHCGLTARYLHCRHAYPMSRDWGCISTYCLSSYVPILVYAALGAIPTVTCTFTPMVVCIPWWTLPYAFDTDSSPPHVC